MKEESPSPLAFLGLGFELVLPVVLLLLAGNWLDGRWGSGPWLAVGGAFVGGVIGFYGMFRRVLPGRKDEGDR